MKEDKEEKEKKACTLSHTHAHTLTKHAEEKKSEREIDKKAGRMEGGAHLFLSFSFFLSLAQQVQVCLVAEPAQRGRSFRDAQPPGEKSANHKKTTGVKSPTVPAGGKLFFLFFSFTSCFFF